MSRVLNCTLARFGLNRYAPSSFARIGTAIPGANCYGFADEATMRTAFGFNLVTTVDVDACLLRHEAHPMKTHAADSMVVIVATPPLTHPHPCLVSVPILSDMLVRGCMKTWMCPAHRWIDAPSYRGHSPVLHSFASCWGFGVLYFVASHNTCAVMSS